MANGGSRDWTKLLVAVGLFVVAGAIYYFTPSNQPALPSDVNFVCVATGQSFKIDRHKVNTVPMPNPRTGDATLLPCVKKEDGIYVDRHYEDNLKQLAEKNKYVDPKTLRVRPPS